jgi:Tfp pilus assembly protein PilZ
MSEAAQLARTAREHLASALKALQSSPDVPDELLDVAEPIAEAMSILHRIERTDGANLDGREGALANVRAALEKIQKVSEYHPASDVVMEAVASSLSKVHALTRYVPPAPAPAEPSTRVEPAAQSRANPQPIPAPPAAQQVPVAAAPRPVMTQAVPQPQPSEPSRATVPHPREGGVGPKGTLIPHQNQPNPFAALSPQAAALHAQPAPAAQPSQPQYGQYAHPVAQQPVAQQPVAQQHVAQQPAAPAAQAYQPQPAPVARAQSPVPPAPARAPAAAPAPAREAATTAPATPNAGRIDVELGIHSASNFYKGLSGNDVIEHGGIFVATYKSLKMGASVNLRVLLPGDYEFNAIGVVQWTRAAGDGSEPGFGARFTQITPEGRQLVYRYARNREPMFYDDL